MCRQAGCDARCHRRGGVRGGGHVRDAAPARRARASPCSRPPADGAWSPPTRSRAPALELLPLPDDLRAAHRRRSSRPGGVATTRSTSRAPRRVTRFPRCMELIAAHPAVDAVVYLGLGIQSNQARLMRDGPFYPGPRARAHRRRTTSARTHGSRRPPPRCPQRHREADPHRDRARGRRPGQRRTRGRPRERTPLLRAPPTAP